MLNCRETREAVDAASMRSGLTVDAEVHLTSCHECRQYAMGTFQLMSLLSGQPRVEAPADFDFHLRARIARARDEHRGWRAALAQFWSHSFSWKEAGAAAVVLAAVTMSATYYLKRETRTPQGGEIAAVTRSFSTPQPQLKLNQASEKPAIEPLRNEPPSRVVSGARTAARTDRTAARAVPSGTIEMPGAQEILVYQPGRAGRPGDSRSVVIPRRGQVAFGAQLASVRDVGARPPAPNVVETF